MEKISRYILVLVAILTFSIFLPDFYWKLFEKPNRSPFVLYSCIDKDFIIQQGRNRYDNKGNKLTRKEWEEKLPLLNMRQLMIYGLFPDSINGCIMDPHEIGLNKSFFRFKPKDMNTPQAHLFPLFESESGRVKIEMPQDFFRITKRMEFVDAKTNSVIKNKSRMFTAVLQKRGFAFPAKLIAGIPTTRKSCDEGYIVTDSKDQLFHIKMVKGHPYIQKVKVPKGLKFKYIACVDFRDKKYYCYLFSQKNEIYILTQDEYDLIKFPIKDFQPKKEELRIFGDLFNYNVIRLGENYTQVVALDKEYKKVAEYNKTWLSRAERKEGKVFSYIFPAQISMFNKYSDYINFYYAKTKGFNWIILNLLLVFGHFLILKRRKVIFKNHLIDFSIILITGIYGFLAVNLFQNKFFK
ncbi:MAG: DUF4857 domain-containing protein [Bacteroidales bacterium]|nr:DUF4857 domain-containing protein [Bacteroidales bacterium]